MKVLCNLQRATHYKQSTAHRKTLTLQSLELNRGHAIYKQEKEKDLQMFPELIHANLGIGEKLTGTTGRKNEDKKSAEQGRGSWEGHLLPGGTHVEGAWKTGQG